MNAEKFVKKEAKSVLSDNWGIAIFSVLVLLIVPIVSLVIVELSFVFLGDAETVEEGLTNSPVDGALFLFFNVAAIIAFVLLSPLYNGFVRVFSSIADKKTPDPFDLFYFLETKERYKETIGFMTVIILKVLAIICACEAIPVALLIMAEDDNDAMLISGAILAFVGAVAAFLIMHRFNFKIVLYSYLDCSSSVANIVGGRIAKKNTLSLIKLAVTFVPGLLITFFVVPFIYYYPYITCSYMVSTKYLIDNYKETNGGWETVGASVNPIQPPSYSGNTVSDHAVSQSTQTDAAGENNVFSERHDPEENNTEENNSSVTQTIDSISDYYANRKTFTFNEDAKNSVLLSYGDDVSSINPTESDPQSVDPSETGSEF